MRTVLAYALPICLLLSPLTAQRSAASDATALAAAVPVEVSEVVTGGNWSEGASSGFYRAMVIIPAARAQAQVVVQLLAVDQDSDLPKVVKTVPIKEMAEQGYANAFLAMDAETENEMTLIVTAYDSGTDQDTSMHFKFDGKGGYQLQPAPDEEAPAEEAPAPKQ